MSHRYDEAGAARRLVRRAAATRPGSRAFAKIAHRLDRVVYRATGGRATAASWVSGLPVVMLTTTGARSGRDITSPLVGVPDGDAIVIVGSNFGQAHHPAWYHNLRANPRARIATPGGPAHEVVAEELAGAERERLLALASEIYPGYAAYVERAAPRRIALFRLIPS